MAGLTAMFAACTNEDVIENFEAKEALKSEGITFSVASVESRGDFKMDEATSKFVASWNAESDKIQIAHKGVKKNGVAVSAWTDNGVAEYKATKTAAKGEFTSLNESNLLTFYSNSNGTVKASFRAYRPAATFDYTAKDGDVAEKLTLITTVPSTQNQTSATKAPFDNFVMVSEPINDVYVADYAVGESLPLSFERVFAGLAIKTTGYNETVYGKLNSLSITMEKNALSVPSVSIEMAAKKDGKWSYTTAGASSKTVTLTFDNDNNSENGVSGLKWNDNAYAFVQILPVTREKAEDYTVVLNFANGSIEFDGTSSKNWEANNFYTMNLDLSTVGDYLYNSENRKLIVVKKMPTVTAGMISTVTEVIANVALSANDLKQLNKLTNVTTLTLANDAASLGENMANINQLTSLSTLTLTAATSAPAISNGANQDKWTSLTTLNCLAVTEIPAEAYMGNQSITKYNFPKVVTIGENAFEGSLVNAIGVGNDDIVTTNAATTEQLNNTLRIGTYTRADNGTTTSKTSALTTIAENAFANTGLYYIDTPALTTFDGNPFGNTCNLNTILLPSFDWNTADVTARFLAVQANDNLYSIDITGTTAVGGSNISLANKENLRNVILGVNTEVGSSAFANLNNVTIKNLNKIASVGEGAFQNVSFTQESQAINLDVTAVAKKAFYGTNITSFDFADVIEIGESAFENAWNLGSAIVPSVTVIEKNTFKGASNIQYVVLSAATTIKEGSLNLLSFDNDEGNKVYGNGATITFAKPITIEGLPFGPMTATDGHHGSTAEKAILGTFNYTLDVNDAQTGVSGNTLTWTVGGKYYKATFNGIL